MQIKGSIHMDYRLQIALASPERLGWLFLSAVILTKENSRLPLP
jgi:hypothetical protein